MPDYQIVIRIPFTAMDDLEARLRARDIIGNSDICLEDDLPEYKLQKVFKDRPPEGMKL